MIETSSVIQVILHPHRNAVLRFALAFFLVFALFSTVRGDVHFGNGIKIGEVDASSAIVWLRLTDAPERCADGTPFKDDDTKVPDGLSLSDMKDSLMGAPGGVRLRYQAKDGAETATGWQNVDPQRDFTAQVRLADLKPATAYTIIAEGRAPGGDASAATCEGSFTFRILISPTPIVGGFLMKDRTPEHRFLCIKGSFLSVDVNRADDQPRVIFRHHDVHGKIVHEETFSHQPKPRNH